MDTMAVVANIIGNQGVVRIFEKDSDKRVVVVGTQDARNIVIVPRDSKWWLRASRSINVGYVIKKTNKKSNNKSERFAHIMYWRCSINRLVSSSNIGIVIEDAVLVSYVSVKYILPTRCVESVTVTIQASSIISS